MIAPHSPASVSNTVVIQLKGIPTRHEIGIKSLVLEMLKHCHLSGDFVLVIKKPSRCSGGDTPHVRIRHAEVLSVLLAVRTTSENSSHYDCALSKSGMRAEELHNFLMRTLGNNRFEPVVRKKVSGTTTPFVEPNTSIASVEQPSKIVTVEPVQPAVVEPLEPISLCGFTRNKDLMNLVLVAIEETYGINPFTRTQFYAVLEKEKFCPPNTPPKSRAQIIQALLRQGLFKGLQEDSFLVTEIGRARIAPPKSEQISVVPAPPLAPVVAPAPVSVDTKGSVALVQHLMTEGAKIAEMQTSLAKLDGEIVTYNNMIADLTKTRDSVSLQAEKLRAELAKPETVELQKKIALFQSFMANVSV